MNRKLILLYNKNLNKMTNVLSGTSVDLLIKENTNRFGNLKFFYGAKCLFNPKMIGLHFTTLVFLSTTALTIYLM